MNIIKRIIALFSFLSIYSNQGISQSTELSSGEIQLAIKKLNTVGSVLYIAAHPDDENTRLLGWLANEKCVRTAYLSINRGDGGQNLIGKDQSELLGLIRTQELLAARRIDGAEQFFTRANDFGYSKNPEETFTIWDHDKILADVVWVIRNFKPDIIITRFPTTGEGGHGNHTASAILAGEAFKISGDSTQFPEQLNFVKPWKATSLWWNTFNFGATNTTNESQYKINIGTFNPYLGKAYGEIASESRSMHKSQGFGVAKIHGEIMEYFKFLDGDSVTCKDLFCGIDMTWKRISGSDKIENMINSLEKEFQPSNPSLVVPKLVLIYQEIQKIKDDYWRTRKLEETEKLIRACSGFWTEAVCSESSFVPGDSLKIKVSVVKNMEVDIRLTGISFDDQTDTILNKSLNKNELVTFQRTIITPSGLDYSTPYWLKNKHGIGSYEVNDQLLISKPENVPPLYVTYIFTVGGQSFQFKSPVQTKWVDPVQGEKYRIPAVSPPAVINFGRNVFVFQSNETKKIKVTVQAQRDNINGTLKISLPTWWTCNPMSVPVIIERKNEEAIFYFTVSSPPQGTFKSNEDILKASLLIDKKVYSKSLTEIKYDHIPDQTLFPESEIKLKRINIQKKGSSIGYIPGAGDDVAECLEQIGYNVNILTDELLSNEPLKKYDAIITGIRAYNTNERMPSYYKKLMSYVEEGGNLIVQYNTNNNLSNVNGKIGPYPFTISRDRVTVEQAPVTLTDPSNEIFNTPNKITNEDFDGWVQERGLYFATQVDSGYKTLMSMNDPGEKPLSGSTILAAYGKGNFIYTGLSFFRQLPAGVPGAYRLLVNMISTGKK